MALQQLVELFPGSSATALQQALDKHGGDVERAAEFLILYPPAVEPVTLPTFSTGRASTPASSSRQQRARSASVPPHTKWSKLGQIGGATSTTPTAAASPAAVARPRFIDPATGAGPGAQLTSAAFPSLGAAAATADSGDHSASALQPPPAAGATALGRRKSGSWPQIAGAWGQSSRAALAAGAAPPAVTAAAAGRRPVAPVTTGTTSSSAVKQPKQQHPHQQHKQAPQAAAPAGDTTDGWREDAAAALAAQHAWAGEDLVRVVLESMGWDIEEGCRVLEEMGGSSSSSGTHNSSGKGSASGCSKGGASGQAAAAAAAGGGSMHRQGASGDAGDTQEGDVYRSERAEALRLTKRWQQAMRRAAAAYAGGDKAEARRVAAEAATLRRAAADAHAAASERIFRRHNAGRGGGLWELDLHGLHISEAIEALRQRLEAIQQHAQHAQHADSGGRPSGVLRVIVGKGNHSSGGEASLPRSVATWLDSVGLGYRPVGGALEVAVRPLAWTRRGAAAAPLGAPGL